MRIESNSELDTLSLAEKMAAHAAPGDIFALYGELGAGKTVFAKGFARGLGIKAHVTSPTFTILKCYEGGRLPLYHFDMYRIEDPSELYAIDYEEYFFGRGVTLVEWPENIAGLIPENAMRILILKVPGSENMRLIEIENFSEAAEC